MNHDVGNCFQQHFSAELAVTMPQIEEAFRLRYRVYCDEAGYEDPARFPDGLERDRFDTHSLQMIVRHRASRVVVGAVRLIMPCWWDGSWSFPFETVCGRVDRYRLGHEDARRQDAAEVSRFAVSRTALAAIQRCDLNCGSAADPLREDRGGMPQLVALGLIALLFGASAGYGIGLWYAMMELALARRLSKLGIDFRQIGPPVEHRGKRYPMAARVDDLLQSIANKNPAFHEMIEGMREAVLAGSDAPIAPGVFPYPLVTTSGAWPPSGPFTMPPHCE